MNDALVAAIRNAVPGLSPMGLKDAANAVRAWLSLPPSEEEIAAAIAIADENLRHYMQPVSEAVLAETICGALVASRGVLVRPPEDEKGTS